MPDVTLTDTQLHEIEARVKAATPGPWTIETQLGIDDPRSPDTTFVLHARADIPALIAALRASRERERRLAALPDLWMRQQAEYPARVDGQIAAAAVRACAKELRAALGEEAKS